MAKSLDTKELIAIAIGGMVGGGIFSILGISVSMIGFLAPFAIALGGVFAFFAAYSYVKLGVYYLDEGATYAFVKRTFPRDLISAAIGWLTVFGYISTLALYAYTFSSYTISSTEYAQSETVRKVVAIGIIWLFAFINLWSVKGMGRVEDVIVYSKLTILLIVSWALLGHYKMSPFVKTNFKALLIPLAMLHFKMSPFVKTNFKALLIPLAMLHFVATLL